MKKKGILWVLLSVLLIVSLSGCKAEELLERVQNVRV